MSQTPLTPFVNSFAGQLISHTPELMRDLYIPAAQEHGAQRLDQRFGAVRYHDPLTEQSLMNLVDRLCLLAASMCEETLASRNQQIDQLDRDARNLQERLKDALEALETNVKTTAVVVAADLAAPAPPVLAFDPPTVTPHPTLGERNGVTPPKSGVTERCWRIADHITEINKKEGNPPASKAQVVAVATMEGIKESTAGAAFSSWAKFFGLNPKDTSQPAKVKEAPVAVAPPPPIPTYAPPPPIPAYAPPPPIPA